MYGNETNDRFYDIILRLIQYNSMVCELISDLLKFLVNIGIASLNFNITGAGCSVNHLTITLEQEVTDSMDETWKTLCLTIKGGGEEGAIQKHGLNINP